MAAPDNCIFCDNTSSHYQTCRYQPGGTYAAGTIGTSGSLYSPYSSIFSGLCNCVISDGCYASILNGNSNTNSGCYNSIIGGANNTINSNSSSGYSSNYSSIGGGNGNSAFWLRVVRFGWVQQSNKLLCEWIPNIK